QGCCELLGDQWHRSDRADQWIQRSILRTGAHAAQDDKLEHQLLPGAGASRRVAGSEQRVDSHTARTEFCADPPCARWALAHSGQLRELAAYAEINTRVGGRLRDRTTVAAGRAGARVGAERSLGWRRVCSLSGYSACRTRRPNGIFVRFAGPLQRREPGIEGDDGDVRLQDRGRISDAL